MSVNQNVSLNNPERSELSKLGEAALEYAKQGHAVFPCVPKGKSPLTPNGFKDATTDPIKITQYWTRWPTANIGLVPGVGCIVLDIDPRNGGQVPQGLPRTYSVLTGGGGEHHYYRLPASSEPYVLRSTLTQGVDIKGNGTGYVLAPGSITEAQYTRQSNSLDLPVELPQELLALVLKPEIQYSEQDYYDDPTDNRPGTQFNRRAGWNEILEPHGWRLVGFNRATHEGFWCRPGKSEGISATTNYAGTGLLYVFTSSTEFESHRGYTKFNAYTILSFGGDFSAAAASLVEVTRHNVMDEVNVDDISLLRAVTVPKEDSRTGSEQMVPEYSGDQVRSGLHRAASDLHPRMTEYNFTPAFPPDHFVSKYIEYVNNQTDAPMEYAEAGALSLLSASAYRSKASLAPYPGGLANNLYVCLVGETTRSRKSTVQRITTDILKSFMPPSVLPNRATTEALIKALANRNGVPSVWCPDEFGVTLAEIYNRDFMKGLEEMLLTVYSGDDYVYERVMDSVRITSPHLSVLGAATPESISRAGTTALDSGLLPRFAIVYPAVLPEPRTVGVANTIDLRSKKQYFTSKLNQILAYCNNNTEVTFSNESLVLLNTAEQDLIGVGTARLPTMLYKVASLAALSSSPSRNVVSGDDAISAIAVVQRWAEGVSNLMPEMYKHGTDQQFDQQVEYVYGLLDKASDHSVLRVDLANMINVKKQRLDELESTLVDRGKIRVETGQGGKRWHLL